MHDEDKDNASADASSAAAPQPDNENGPVNDDSAAPPLQPFSRSASSSSRNSFHPDVPARPGSIPGMPAKPTGPADAAVAIDPQHLLMGREINLKGGKITSCKRLTLDGQIVDAVLTGAQVLEVSAVGTFKGKAEVDEAIIAGHFEGELKARKRLLVRETGSISGNVSYGSIIIEPGGQISGEMQTYSEKS